MRSSRRFAIILSSFVAFIASLFIIFFISTRPPKESNVISNFSTHRAAYEQVRTMLSEDKDVDLVATWGIETEGSPISTIPPDGGMPVKRYQDYLALLKEIGASAVAKGRDQPEVRFLVWRSGFAADTRHVAVSWLEQEPPNKVVSLDAFYQTAKPRRPSYVHIDGKWYIWADW